MSRCALLVAVLAGLGVAQVPERPRPDLEFLGGRALENDTHIPIHAAAEARLAAGDAAFAAARKALPDAAAPRETIDAWRDALLTTRAGDAVRARPVDPNAATALATWLPDPSGARERIVTGVEYAVRERLLLAGEPTRRAWRERFEAQGGLQFASVRGLGDGASMLAVERTFTATRAAANAALALADLALERGEDDRARAWTLRALGNAADADVAGEFATAAVLRTRALAPRADADAGRAAWSRATRFARTDGQALGEEELTRPTERTRVLLGATEDGAGGLFVQGAERLLYRAANGTWSTAELGALLAGERVSAPFADRASDWPTAPDAADGRALCVVGRTNDELDDALLCAELPALRRVWLRAGAADLPDAARVEYAPGARLLLDRAFAQVRVWRAPAQAQTAPGARAESVRLAPGAIEARLVELDAATGALRGSTVLARGASRVAARERENLGITWLAPPPAPLGRDGTMLLVSTGLGTLSAFDALDGRLHWTVRTARARADERQVLGLAAPVLDGAFGAFSSDDGPELAVWRRSPLAEPGGLGDLLVTPFETLERGTFLGFEAGRLLVATEGGHVAESGRGTSLAFGPRERLLRAAVVLPGRAIVVTEHALLLLDRDQDLRVLDRVELGPGEAGLPVLANGWIWVVGPRRVAGFAPAGMERVEAR